METEPTKNFLGLKEQFAGLREFTRLTGGLHEYQVRHLQLWPLVFTEYDSSECQFDYESKTVTFVLSKKKRKLTKMVRQRFYVEFTKAVINLLGDYKLVLKTPNKVLYES